MSTKQPCISIVMPCYNEEVAIAVTAPALIKTFSKERIELQLVLVNNGSTDRTGEIIEELINEGYPIKKVEFKENQGYGGGILHGLAECEAPIVGFLCADGQVSSEDVLMAYRLILGREDRVLTKVRRRFREDSWKRKIISIIYNGLMQVLYGRLGAIDINGSPKIFSRKTFEAMELVSKDWFLDPEIIIKCKYLGLRVIEVDVEGVQRKGGTSNVNLGTCVEFLKNLTQYRLGNRLGQWKGRITEGGVPQSLQKKEAAVVGGLEPLTASTCCFPQSPEIIPGVKVLEQKRFEDSRGFVQKVLTASQCNGNTPQGEVYVTSARPGEAKGNHYHLKMGEWFSIVQGSGYVDIWDPKSGSHTSIPMGESNPRTVYVPAGLGHAIVNTGESFLICIAWAEREHDPADVYPSSPHS